MYHLFWLIPAAALVAILLFFWRIGRAKGSPLDLDQVRQRFNEERTNLQRLFFEAASTSGKPRGLRWKECQWNDLTAWVRDKATGQLLALVGVTISFEAIEGGDMEGLEAVGNLRNASAVFFYDDGKWRTVGRVIFNLNPDEAVEHFKDGYVRIV